MRHVDNSLRMNRRPSFSFGRLWLFRALDSLPSPVPGGASLCVRVMNKSGTLRLLIAALLLAGCAAQEPIRNARRPVDFFEISRFSKTSEPETELVTTQFRLLERAEVCSDMGISQEQSNALRKVYETPWTQLPGWTEFRAQDQAARQKPGLTQEERIALNFATSRGMGRVAAQFWTQEIRAILSPQQGERLEQLLLQARGPLMLLIDTNLAAALKLSPEQTQRMADAVRQADGRMIPTFQQFGRGFLAGFSANETAESRRGAMNAQIPQLRRMVEERDQALTRVLTPEQQSRLKAREGKPLPIEWDPWEFVKEPFEKVDQ
jgi:hypothetical protein